MFKNKLIFSQIKLYRFLKISPSESPNIPLMPSSLANLKSIDIFAIKKIAKKPSLKKVLVLRSA